MSSSTQTMPPGGSCRPPSRRRPGCGHEDDQGIWELRGPPRPFVHSKLMCWVALDRGLRLADDGTLDGSTIERWTDVREAIRADIETRGWNDDVGAFTESYGSDELDASVLLMAMVGFLPGYRPAAGGHHRPDRGGPGRRARPAVPLPRRRRVRRPRGHLPAVHVLARARVGPDRAGRAVSGSAGPGRLLRQPAGPACRTGRYRHRGALGNYPQAFSHLDLVNAAQALADAESCRTSMAVSWARPRGEARHVLSRQGRRIRSTARPAKQGRHRCHPAAPQHPTRGDEAPLTGRPSAGRCQRSVTDVRKRYRPGALQSGTWRSRSRDGSGVHRVAAGVVGRCHGAAGGGDPVAPAAVEGVAGGGLTSFGTQRDPWARTRTTSPPAAADASIAILRRLPDFAGTAGSPRGRPSS